MWNEKGKDVAKLPKVCGADIELGNFFLGAEEPAGTGREASRALLREIEGLPLPSPNQACGFGLTGPDQYGRMELGNCEYPAWSATQGSAATYAQFDPQDWGRKFLPSNGGCVYIDLDHLEICLPEIISAWDWVGAYRAMIITARHALREANRLQESNRRIQVLINNSDGRGNSYGGHLNFLITRRAWDNLFLRKMHHLLFLATYQVSSIIFAGQGKVGSENGASPAAYQLSQRADFCQTLFGPQTTFDRPIVNSRDESLCGKNQTNPTECARLHVIFFDSNLAQGACLLKVGVTQIILAMIEAEYINPNLLLDDPVEALTCFSHDPTLKARALTVGGKYLSALELQSLFLEDALRFVSVGGCDGIVPRAGEILHLWEDTLQKLRNREFAALSRRIDWVLKLQIIARALEQQPELSWNSPQILYLDQLYSSLEDSEGLFWTYERNGFVERVVSENQINRFLNNPPEDTRAYARAMLLRYANPEEVDGVDWDSVSFRIRRENYWPNRRTVDLEHPLGHTRNKVEACFRNAESLEEVLDAFDSMEHRSRVQGSTASALQHGGSVVTH